VVAEGFLAEASAIDLLAVGGEGEIISIRIGRGGDDIALFTQSLADLSWLRPRLADLLKLAPGLGLEPSAAPRAMLMCPEFARETRAAAENFPNRSIQLATYHCLRQQGQLSVLLESRSPSQQKTDAQSAAATPLSDFSSHHSPPATAQPRPRQQLADSPSPSGFRTGLSDADLKVEIEEEKILD
jgi:hypothetical protein